MNSKQSLVLLQCTHQFILHSLITYYIGETTPSQFWTLVKKRCKEKCQEFCVSHYCCCSLLQPLMNWRRPVNKFKLLQQPKRSIRGSLSKGMACCRVVLCKTKTLFEQTRSTHLGMNFMLEFTDSTPSIMGYLRSRKIDRLSFYSL